MWPERAVPRAPLMLTLAKTICEPCNVSEIDTINPETVCRLLLSRCRVATVSHSLMTKRTRESGHLNTKVVAKSCSVHLLCGTAPLDLTRASVQGNLVRRFR